MKTDLHPQYFKDAKVTCACGNVFHVGSTREDLTIEICSACHPFYTGNEKVLDTAGRVEKFKTRMALKKPAVIKAKKPAPVEAPKKEKVKHVAPAPITETTAEVVNEAPIVENNK